MLLLLWTAFLIGLTGSLHCVGMCGPIALAVPFQSRDRSVLFRYALHYHLRSITYAVLGLVVGVLGHGILMAGLQQYFTIILGIGLLLMVILSPSMLTGPGLAAWFPSFYNQLKISLIRALRINNKATAMKIGLLNGLLPCGLVYLALGGALISGRVLYGGMYMFAFGMGTVPLMLALSVWGKRLPLKWNTIIRKSQPFLLALVALLLLFRGFRMEFTTPL